MVYSRTRRNWDGWVNDPGKFTSYFPNGTVAGVTNGIASYGLSVITDRVGNKRGVNGLTMNSAELISHSPINGRRPNGGIFVENFNALPPGQWTTGVAGSFPDDQWSVSTFAAKTNPSRADVDLPVAIYELRDVPHMLKSLQSLPKRITRIFTKSPSSTLDVVAAEYLGYQFGWKPLVSDISKAIQFNSMVNKRTEELDQLVNGNGITRRRTISNRTDMGVWAQHAPIGLASSAPITFQSTRRMWMSGRWQPLLVDIPPVMRSPDGLRKLAVRSVYGLTIDPSTVWEALPWSWLIDWFTNVGDVLAAKRNIVPAYLGGVCLMTYQRTVWNWNMPSIPGLTGGAFCVANTTKNRVAFASLDLTASLGLLTDRQLSILSSILWTRR